MATVLDFSILGSLSIIFVFIAVFVAGWGLLYLVNPFQFKDDNKKKVYAILAFALSFIVILNQGVLTMIKFSIPWLSIILMIGFFMLFFTRMFDPSFKADELIKKAPVWGFLIAFTAIAFMFGFGQAFGQDLLEEQPGLASDADLIEGDTTPTDTFVPADEFTDAEPLRTDGSVGNGPGSGSYTRNLTLTFFHPRILGMFFMMVLATITILLIAR